jgi:hypothetical protein
MHAFWAKLTFVGHNIAECKTARLINRDDVPTMPAEEAWEGVKKAINEGDMDDVQEALKIYLKAVPDTTYVQLEQAFRSQNMDVYIIGLERELALTYSNMDLQGNLDKKYTVTFRNSPGPKRPKERDGWPASAEENFERLADAGIPVDRGVPKCSNCEELGHIAKSCPAEKREPTDKVEVKCYNCDELGHRVRDCKFLCLTLYDCCLTDCVGPKPREDKSACRNCK